MMKLRNGKMLCLTLLLSLSLTSCASGHFNTLPSVVPYGDKFQDRAANELQQLKPPCERDVGAESCSALHRMIMDYSTMRDQTRALGS